MNLKRRPMPTASQQRKKQQRKVGETQFTTTQEKFRLGVSAQYHSTHTCAYVFPLNQFILHSENIVSHGPTFNCLSYAFVCRALRKTGWFFVHSLPRNLRHRQPWAFGRFRLLIGPSQRFKVSKARYSTMELLDDFRGKLSDFIREKEEEIASIEQKFKQSETERISLFNTLSNVSEHNQSLSNDLSAVSKAKSDAEDRVLHNYFPFFLSTKPALA